MKRKTLIIILVVLSAVSLLYWFFTGTVRGSSLALYFAAGWGAPIHTRVQCAHESDQKVYDKFQKPLAFDEQSKNLLKNFWFYSYYRGCLFRNGYDFNGDPVPKSTIEKDIYKNPYANLEFEIPEGSILAADNQLDVDTDDRRFVSNIQTYHGPVRLYFYKNQNDYDNLAALKNLKRIPNTAGDIIGIESFTNPSGIEMLYLTQEDVSGIAFLDSQKNLYFVFASPRTIDILSQIKTSLRLAR